MNEQHLLYVGAFNIQVGDNNMKIMCDECETVFKSSKIKIRKKKITKQIIQYYYTCPKCKHKFVISYEDDEIRENIKRIKELDKEAINITDNNEIVNIMKKRNNLKNRNIEKSNQYMIIFKEVQQMACKPKKKSKSTGKKKK